MKKFFMIILFLVLSLVDACVYAKNISEELLNNVIRLHVIANDDSEKAQSIKLKVRDELLLKMKSEELISYKDACEYVEKHKEELLECIYDVLQKEGADYNASIEFAECDFPTKTYDTLTFPKGRYRAVRVCLGEAKGENWWCVMYPALCFVNEVCEDEESAMQLQSNLSTESFAIVAGKAKFKFKILELFSN